MQPVKGLRSSLNAMTMIMTGKTKKMMGVSTRTLCPFDRLTRSWWFVVCVLVVRVWRILVTGALCLSVTVILLMNWVMDRRGVWLFVLRKVAMTEVLLWMLRMTIDRLLVRLLLMAWLIWLRVVRGALLVEIVNVSSLVMAGSRLVTCRLCWWVRAFRWWLRTRRVIAMVMLIIIKVNGIEPFECGLVRTDRIILVMVLFVFYRSRLTWHVLTLIDSFVWVRCCVRLVSVLWLTNWFRGLVYGWMTLS